MNEPQKPNADPGRQYLEEEAARARAAIGHTLQGIAGNLLEVTDASAWVKQYPWASTGSCAVLGFLAASKVTPARGESFKEKWSETIDELRGRRDNVSAHAADGAAASDGPARASKGWAMLRKALLRIIARFLLRGVLASAADGAAAGGAAAAGTVTSEEWRNGSS